MAKRIKLKRPSYKSGYGKPPKETQFKPGQSGNPKGRPKNTKNLKTDLKEEIHEHIQITEGGQPKKVSKQRAILKRTVEKALKGDMRATELIIKLTVTHLLDEEIQNEVQDLVAEDKEILNRFIEEYLNDKKIRRVKIRRKKKKKRKKRK